MPFKAAICRLCFGSKEPESIRWAQAHDAHLQADEQVQARRRAAAEEVARQNRKYFSPALLIFLSGAVGLAFNLGGWPEAQGVLVGGATLISALAFKKFCIAAD
ncbi:MAG: hypothetical protein O9327_03225 [Polaromonas sp.]|nr:hypothetical protein [Polaromonas sp.]